MDVVDPLMTLIKFEVFKITQILLLLWTSNAASVVFLFLFLFLNKVKIMLIYDEPLLRGQPPF